MPIPGVEKNIGRLLENSAKCFSDKKLIHFHHENVSFSYQQFNNTTNQYANVFQKVGIKQGDHIAVMLSNCPEFLLTWLALAKLGAITVPLNIRYRAEDLVYTLNDSDSVGLIIEDQFIPVFQKAKKKTSTIRTVLTVGDEAEYLGPNLPKLAQTASYDFTGSNVKLDDIANILYTSGTTGFPKGCLLSHEYWLTISTVLAKKMKEDDVFLCVEPFYYMDPPWELLMCIIRGMTMIADKSFSPSRYMELVNQYNISVSWAPLSAWIYKQPESSYDKKHNLRLLFSGTIPKDIHKPFEKRFNAPLREGYGMTEIGAGIFMPLEDNHMSGSGSVGKPFEYRYVKIVDENGQEVPQGDIGELWITGPGMFSGYYNKPTATARSFEGEWFKTGDLFRQDKKGYYYILGRKKDMIKRSGDNISAMEVENALVSHPKILAAAVIPVPDQDRKEEVKAYIIPTNRKGQDSIPPEEVIDYCLDRIAEFKVPRYIEYRKEDFSRTPTGKIMKHKLLTERDDLTAGCYDRLKRN
jgi:crotonobetaine/carnitine-CoA ligase